MLETTYREFIQTAKTLPGFIVGQKEDVPYDITELANGYVKADKEKDDIMKNKYMAALMVRYWHMTTVLWESSKTLKIEPEDVVYWLYEGFNKAFYYASWLDPNKEISKDPKGAEKCINQCITSVRQWWFKNLNQYKRKVNAEIISGDITVDEDNKTTLFDMQEDESATVSRPVDIYVSYLINKGYTFDALVVDGICKQDSFIEKHEQSVRTVYDEQGNTKEEPYTKYFSEFSPRRLAHHLMNLTPEFVNYFENEYGVPKNIITEEILKLSTYDKRKMRESIAKSLNRIKLKRKVFETICTLTC